LDYSSSDRLGFESQHYWIDLLPTKEEIERRTRWTSTVKKGSAKMIGSPWNLGLLYLDIEDIVVGRLLVDGILRVFV